MSSPSRRNDFRATSAPARTPAPPIPLQRRLRLDGDIDGSTGCPSSDAGTNIGITDDSSIGVAALARL